MFSKKSLVILGGGIIIVVLGIVYLLTLKNIPTLSSRPTVINRKDFSNQTQVPKTESQPTQETKTERFSLLVGIGANFYADFKVKALLQFGDQLLIPVNRRSADVPITSDKVKSALEILKGLNTTKTGVEKTIMFSSVNDFKNYVNLLPSDINWVFYDMEGGMTPLDELSDPVGTVKKFADIAHKNQKKAGFGPTNSMYDNLEKTGRLKEILKYTDKVTFQGQNVVSKMSEEEFISLIQKKYVFIQDANQANAKSVKFYLQLWSPQQSPETMIRLFNKLSSLQAIDYAGIGGLKSSSDVINILQSLRQ